MAVKEFAAPAPNHWTTAGYNFVFLPNTADTSGATGQYNTITLWGPDNQGTNAAALPLSSPTGGNYIAADDL
jgi:hypothetical protein